MSGPRAREVAELLAERMPELARALAGEPSQRSRDEWRYGRRGSLAIKVAGIKRGSWYDHEAGDFGDALALVAHLRREPMHAAYAWALAWLPIANGADIRSSPRTGHAAPKPPAPATLDLARSTWLEAGGPAGTLVARYLAARGLDLPPDAPIRFHPRAWRNPAFGPHGPAMVALMTGAETGEPCGIHVTYLRADGSAKAEGARTKIMLGRVGCIRLAPDDEVTLGLGVAEGIETALSVAQGFGWRPVWAATSAGAIKRFPVLPGIEAITIFADPDGAGAAAAQVCAERWVDVGREARVCTPPRGDFNDLLRERAA